jgi:prepilin-type N-terminal cleavage/methylation domain-containing protein
MKNKAFTLIELLVVIAIIGILAGVVIASLNSARTKGRHAAIKSNLRNAVSQATIYFNENGTYTGLCSDPKIQEILSALGGAGKAACYVHANTIQDLDWGIAATYNGIHFTADPAGVLQLDSVNNPTDGSAQIWDAAMASCAAVGKRIPGVSSLKALYDITSSPPSTLTPSHFWSSTPHPTNSAYAYLSLMYNNGNLGITSKSSPGYVRCAS